jgi:hypothetical protein
MKEKRTDMEGVVVPAEPKDEGLFGAGLVREDVVWSAILRGRLSLRRTGDELGKFIAGSLRAEVERGALLHDPHAGFRKDFLKSPYTTYE